MLVLTRMRGEAILVGEARITIEAVRGDKVRLGIEAPRSIRIDREEIALAKQAEGRTEGTAPAARPAPGAGQARA